MIADQIPDLLVIGLVFFTGWVAHVVGAKTHVPRVTLLLTVGILSGPSGFDLIPPEFTQYYSTASHLALAMIGFLLGESFAGRDLLLKKRQVLFISFGVALAPAMFVFTLVWLVSSDIFLAIVLAGIATATDPAATLDVIREYKAKGPVSQMLKGVVAVDDAWGVIIFSLLLVVAMGVSGNGTGVSDVIHGLWDVVGALMLGTVIGIPMSIIIGRYRTGEPTMIEAMGFVFICGGIALYMEVSYILACMALGAMVSRKAQHVERPFHAIEKASDPFLIVFFILSGMSLDLSSITTIGVIGCTYVVARSLGKIYGARLFAALSGSPKIIQQNLGCCLLPQAGIAIGMALLVSERFPEIGELVLTIAVSTTVLFELIGPFVTKRYLEKAGEMS